MNTITIDTSKRMYLIATFLFIIIFSLATFGGFYAGIIYQRTHSNQFLQINPLIRNRYMFGRFGNGIFYTGLAKTIVGKISSMSGNQITVILSNGTQKIITLSSATQIIQMISINKSDIKKGNMVSIVQQIQSGKISAETIRIYR